jgi:sulfur-oxidizing protein SoxX
MQPRKLLGAAALSALFAVGAGTIPMAGMAADVVDLEQGKALAFDRKKGNCLACHMIAGGVSPGNIGPPLVAMKARYPERQKLKDQIWDATAINPEVTMPPYGRHVILTEAELEKVVDFIWSL